MGKMGTLHLAGWNRVPGAEVVATMDHSGNVTDLAGLVDICVVATPTPNHVGSALELISAGIHCLVEKPLAPTESEARLVADSAHRHGVFLGVGHTERFNPRVSDAVAMLRTAAGADGICLADIRRDAVAAPEASPGVVLDLMIHDIDWVLHSLSEMPEDVVVLDTRASGESLSAVHCELRFARGRSVRLSADHTAGRRRREVVVLPDGSGRSVVNLDMPAGAAGEDDAVTRQARAFLTALAGAPSAIATGRDAVRTAAVADLIRSKVGECQAARW